MNYRAIALSATALAVFSACSGNGTSSMQPLAAPTMAASAAPTMPASAAPAALSQANFTTAMRGTQMGLAATNGFAVYNFDLDLTTPGLSACAAPVPPATTGCTTFWPPVVPPTGVTLVAPFGKITRPEGTLQLTYNGHPLYTYANDTTAANATGDGLNAAGGVWHLAQPSTADLQTPDFAPSSAPSAAPTTTPVGPYSASRAPSR